MNRYYSILAAAILVGFSVTPAGTAAPSKYDEAPFESTPLVQQMLNSSVTVLHEHNLKLTAHKDIVGAGVIVRAVKGEPLVVLTVTHVADDIEDGGGYIAVTQNGKQVLHRVTVLYDDHSLDLALLITVRYWEGPDIAATLAPSSPKRGDPVWIVGAPSGADRNVTFGVLSNKKLCEKSTGYCYRTDAELYFGNSGGGVFDARGFLVGIADYVQVEYIEDAKGITHMVVLPGGGGILAWNSIGTFLERHLPR